MGFGSKYLGLDGLYQPHSKTNSILQKTRGSSISCLYKKTQLDSSFILFVFSAFIPILWNFHGYYYHYHVQNNYRVYFSLAIQTQMAFELGIFPNNSSDDYLSYDKFESALRTAIERLKCWTFRFFSSAGRRIQIVICVCVCMSAYKYIYIYDGFCTYYISHLGLFFVCSVCVFFSSLLLLLVLIVLGVVQRFFFFPTIVLLSYTRVFCFLFDVQTKKNMCVGSFSFVFFCVYYYHHSHLYKIIIIIIQASILSVCVGVY